VMIICGPVNSSEYPCSDLSFIDNLCHMFGFLIPEARGGRYYCPDPSMINLPSSFLSDVGCFYSSVSLLSLVFMSCFVCLCT
jgi:hypothetical protein